MTPHALATGRPDKPERNKDDLYSAESAIWSADTDGRALLQGASLAVVAAKHGRPSHGFDMAAIQQSSPIIWWWFSKTTTILWGSSSVQPLSQSSVIFRNSTAGAGLMKHATTLRATYERATPQQHSGKSKPTPLFTMQLVGALDYSLALVVCGFGVVYLSLGLAIYCSPQRGDRLAALNDGTSFLKRKFFIYSVSSFAFMASFFIARQKPDNQLLIFVLFNAWSLSNSLCISA
ncbi:hypothetical protein MY4038_007741 [Beauveria bassiana]